MEEKRREIKTWEAIKLLSADNWITLEDERMEDHSMHYGRIQKKHQQKRVHRRKELRTRRPQPLPRMPLAGMNIYRVDITEVIPDPHWIIAVRQASELQQGHPDEVRYDHLYFIPSELYSGHMEAELKWDDVPTIPFRVPDCSDIWVIEPGFVYPQCVKTQKPECMVCQVAQITWHWTDWTREVPYAMRFTSAIQEVPMASIRAGNWSILFEDVCISGLAPWIPRLWRQSEGQQEPPIPRTILLALPDLTGQTIETAENDLESALYLKKMRFYPDEMGVI